MKRLLVLTVAVAGALQLCAAKVVNVSARSVRSGDDDVSDVISRCEVKPGSDYDPAACARDIKALRDSGDYEDIAVEARHGAEGIDVVYVITPKPRYHGPLNCKGNEYWNASKIAKFADLKDGYAYGEADIAAAANRIRNEYRKKQFPDVTVTPEIEAVPGAEGSISVTMVIDEGQRCKIKAYLFEGNEHAEAADLRETFGWYPWWNPIGWFNDDPVTKQDLAEAREKIAEHYRNLGYLDVSVADAERVMREDGETANIVFKIGEGPCYRVKSLAVTGVKKYPEAAALAAVKAVKAGDIAGEKALKDAAREIEIFCGSGEHPLAETHVTVKRTPSLADGETLDVVFDVEEGVPVTIDRVLIRGNDYPKDKVVRR